ncbi:CBN-DOP-2 protein [Caenorhabditis brenneri]|uniref:CBN-DOP-2 protein n=1 Tax=Caenorhabditis brenneri TaxID=135651 RepID=G0NPR6_CAEBE|nr:CBN-DOP-2 protein [Caenorhabditis brenneri]
MEAGETWNVSLEWPPPNITTTETPTFTQMPPTAGSGIPLNYAGLFLIVIPLITLLGNLLVIISVLRYRALQSAINFLILGLAVADLLVAIIVMPYAVYVYVTNGDWYLGNLMCDVYMASDVCCSTASILLLAVISFDRYRAVSLPIQYSRQSQNVKRVCYVIAVIWLVSLTLASPMVFGVNVRPPDANPYECRFYNAEFSILSSMISFVLPCFLVLFVYIRIIIALKKREKAAKMRREKNTIAHGLTMRPDTGDEQVDEEAAGRIVAGPVVNVMMAALPSMTRRMRQFERHRRAIELAGEEEWEEEDELDVMDECCGGDDAGDDDDDYHADDGQGVVEASAPRTTSMLRRIINAASVGTTSSAAPSVVSTSGMPAFFAKNVSTTSPSSSSCARATTTTTSATSKASNAQPPLPMLLSMSEFNVTHSVHHRFFSAPSPSFFFYFYLTNVFTAFPLFFHYFSESLSLAYEREFGNSSTPRSSIESLSENVNVITNDFISENCTTISRRSSYGDDSQPTSSQTSSGDGRNYNIKGQKRFRNLSRNYSTKHHRKVVKVNRSNSRSNSRSASITNQAEEAFIPSIIRTISRRSPRLFRRDKADIKKHSMILANPITESPKEYRRVSMPIRPTNSQTETETISASRDIDHLPTTTLSRSTTANSAELLGSPDEIANFPALITETVLEDVLAETKECGTMQPTVSFALTVREMEGNALNNLKGCSAESSRRVSQADPPLAIQILTRPSLPNLDLQRMDSIGTTCSSKTRADSLRSVDSKSSKKSSRNGIAVKLVKRAIKHEHSLKRKVSKAQRKEKRATKTLGVVVGVFLVCWVPFFVINILNAVCILLNKDSCQVGYDLFFYCTWIGYMNSFMNPIIYTIFNTEFRRAFKSILFGRNSTRHHFSNKQAHV